MNERRAILKPFDDPGRASVEEGYVLLDGPDGLAVAMTPAAAARTAESLLAAVEQARGMTALPSGPRDDSAG